MGNRKDPDSGGRENLLITLNGKVNAKFKSIQKFPAPCLFVSTAATVL